MFESIEDRLKVPVDSVNEVANKHSSLYQEVLDNRSQCLQLDNDLRRVMAAAMRSKAKQSCFTGDDTAPSSSTCSSNTMMKTVKSVDSIQEIVSCSDGGSVVPNTPVSVDDFVQLASEGKLDLTDELIKELYVINTRIDAVNKVSCDLQQKWSEFDSLINKLQLELNNIQQYIKVDNALLHKFILPPKGISSLQFSMCVAHQLNTFLPQLPVKVTWEHISTAHKLRTKNKKSNVIIVRFCNRNIKDMVLNAKHMLPKPLAITEHLTEPNMTILKEAQKLFGYDYVRTDSCKIFIDLHGKPHKVASLAAVRKLYAEYCESIGSGKSDPAPVPASNQHNTNFNYRPAFREYKSSLHSADSVCYKRYDPTYAAMIEKFNPITTINSKKHTSRNYVGRSFYKSGK